MIETIAISGRGSKGAKQRITGGRIARDSNQRQERPSETEDDIVTREFADMTVSVSENASEQPDGNGKKDTCEDASDRVCTEDDGTNAIKNLAKGYLDGSKMKKKECCPEDQQKETADGKSSCPCPCDHEHDHEHAISEGMPSEMGNSWRLHHLSAFSFWVTRGSERHPFSIVT